MSHTQPVSAPEFQGSPMTRREVLIARLAYENGLVRGTAGEFVGRLGLRRAVELAYPLPAVTRPRVVAVEDQPGVELRSVDGAVEYRKCRTEWWQINVAHGPQLTTGVLAALRSLDAEPTETVTDEGEG